MRVEIDLAIKTKTGLPVMGGDYDPMNDDGLTYKIRKAVFWPNGTLHSVSYLSHITGKWVGKTENGLLPIECIMGPELRARLDPEYRHDYSPKNPSAYGLQAAFDAEKVPDEETNLVDGRFPGTLG